MNGLTLWTGGKSWTRISRAGLHALAGFAAVCLAAGSATATGADLGTWLNTDRKGKIQLRECGDQGLCGEIIWLKDPIDESGKPWRDRFNPDAKLRHRHVIGIDVLIGAKKIGPMTWQGRIYDPEVGKTYYLKHLKVGQDRVEIKGCLSAGWPCRTKYWTRTEPVLPPAPPVQVAKRMAPDPVPEPRPTPAPQVAAPTPVTPVAPPAQARAPYPPQVPQVGTPVLPRPAVQPPQPDVTAALPRPVPNQASGGYLVQVAARQSHNEALRAFSDLQRQYPQILGGLLPEVLKADLGQRGIWYRVGVGPMARQSAAVNFCQRLKSVGADCLIRRR